MKSNKVFGYLFFLVSIFTASFFAFEIYIPETLMNPSEIEYIRQAEKSFRDLALEGNPIGAEEYANLLNQYKDLLDSDWRARAGYWYFNAGVIYEKINKEHAFSLFKKSAALGNQEAAKKVQQIEAERSRQ